MVVVDIFLLAVSALLPGCFLLRRHTTLQHVMVLLVSSAALYLIFLIGREYLASQDKFQHFSILWGNFSLEPIAVIFLAMSGTLWVCNNLYSISYLKMNPDLNQTKLYFFVSLSMLLTCLIAFSSTLLQTFVFYELLTISTYPLVANNLTNHEKKSSRFYLIFLLAISMLLFLPVILYLQAIYGPLSYDKLYHIDLKYGWVIAVMFLYGIAKAAVMPMHYWLPRAMVAPIPVSALLHAVAVVKSGIFILIKIFVYILGLGFANQLPEFYGINIITILVALSLLLSSITAIYQTSLKKLLAYSTITQLSICLLSLSLFSKLGVIAALLHMVSHAAAKIGLFFVAGYIYCNARFTEIDDMAGLAKKMPYSCALFVLNSFSIIGIPILAGFISKAYIMYTAFKNPTNYFVIFSLAISILFTANYFVRLLYKFYISPYHPKEKRVIYAESFRSTMLIAICLVSILVCCFGFFYQEIISLAERI